jgi:hypothetical protein
LRNSEVKITAYETTFVHVLSAVWIGVHWPASSVIC